MGRITDYPKETTPENSDVMLLDGSKGTRTIAYKDLKNDITSNIPVPDPVLDIEKYTEETTLSDTDLLFLDSSDKGPRNVTYKTLKDDITSNIPIPDPVLDIEKYPAETTPVNEDLLFLDGAKGPRNITYEALKNTLPQGTKGDPGPPGQDGKDGRSIQSITTDSNNNVIVTFTDNTTQNIGQLNVDISADFLTSPGFGNLRYYNSHFQYYDTATQTWIDTSVTPSNVYIMNMTPQPMQFINGVFDANLMKYKLKWQEPSDTVIEGQVACVVEKVIIRRKLGSVPANENDGDLVIEVKKNQFGSYKNTYFVDEELTPNLGEVYYYKAFPLSTTGFYNYSALNETSRILCKDYELYGYVIDQNESNPASMISYIEDNKDYRSAHMDYTTDTFDYGDWADAFFMKVRPCMLKYDGTVDYYLNPNNYGLKEDGTPSDVADVNYGGNCMIQFPKTYWKIVDNGNDTANIYICNKKLDDKFHCWSHIDANGNEIPYCYMPAYNGFSDGTRLRSLSGKTLTAYTTAQREVTLALANNLTDIVEWYTEVMCDREFVDLLLLLIGKSTNTQTIFGTGNINSGQGGIKATGTLNSKGLFWGNQDYASCVKLFGIENWYGNVWRRIAGWINVNGTQKVKMTYGQSDGSTVDGYNFDGNGYMTILNATPSGATGGYITKMIFNENIILPRTANGSATTYYADGLFFNNGQANYAIVGGASDAGLLSGAFSSHLSYTISNNYWGLCASISCKPLSKTGGTV